MPKFFYTVYTATTIFGALFVYALFFTQPSTSLNKLAFLIYFFFLFGFTFSILNYLKTAKPNTSPEDKKQIYRKSLRKGLSISIVIILVLAWRFFS